MKDAYYFSHDSNAKDDPKCVSLIEQLGLEGYGIYWVLIEILRDQSEYKYPIALIPAIARRYNTTLEKVNAVVYNYSLFLIIDNDFFFSESLKIRMQALENKREQAKMAGRMSAVKRSLKFNENSTSAQQTFNDRSTDVQRPLNGRSTTVQPVKESKVKESKVKESKVKDIEIPSLEDVKNYCIERKNKVDPDRWYDFYLSKNWMIGKNKMKNWQAAVRNWEKNENNGTNQQNFKANNLSTGDMSKFNRGFFG
jgi:hypothetical protein